MKKIVIAIVAVAVAIGFIGMAIAGDEVKLQEKTSGDKTVTKKEVKSEGTMLKTKKTEKPGVEYGTAKFKSKEGAIKDLNIKWRYFMKDNNYITQYTVLDRKDPELLKELNLTPTEANLIKPGTHKVVSTSPYTIDDIRSNMRSVIIKDMKTAVDKQ